MTNIYIDSICPNLSDELKERIIKICTPNAERPLKFLASVIANSVDDTEILDKIEMADLNAAEIEYAINLADCNVERFTWWVLNATPGQILRAVINH